MAKYTSGKQRNLKVGLTSYSENKTSLEVVGKVGIGTTNATSSLYIVGDQYVTGIITASSFSGNVSYASTAGIATEATYAGYATTAGIATNAVYAGYATTAGIATEATYAGYATTAGIATNSTYAGYATTAGIATEATNVIGGIASVSQLYVTTGISTLGVVTSGNIFSTGVVTATKFVGPLEGNATSASSALSAGTAGSASNATNLTGGGTASANSLTITGNSTLSGIATFGNSSIGIKIDGTTGIISSSNPGVTTVTYYGNLVGTAQVDVENVTNTSNVIGGIASVTQLYVSGLSTVGVLTASRIGIGTTNPTSELWVGGNIFVTGISTLGTVKISSGIITSTTGTAVTFFGDFVGTATSASFATTSFTLNNKTESQLNVASATTSTNVIGGIASVSSLFVNDIGISTLGTIKISSGIISSTTGTAVTFIGNLTGTASTASFATTAFSLNGTSVGDLRVGFATTSTNVIGGIASVSSLFVNDIGISTLGTVKISSGIITSTTGTAVTFFGDFVGTATSASFATTSFTLNNRVESQFNVASATTSSNVIGGIASVSSLFVNDIGISTLGTIKISSGIITSSNPGFTTVTFVGNLIGTASTASFATTAFSLNGTSVGDLRVGFATTATDVIGGIASVSQLSVSGVSTVGVLTATRIGIGTTNASSELIVVGNVVFGGTGIVTAVEYNGNLRIGTPSGGFKTGAVGIITADFTKDSINDINSILGKLVPKPPTTIAGVALTVTTSGNPSTALLCNGFTPTNNAGTGVVTPTAGTTYKRNTNNTVSSTSLSQYGPGDSGTVTALLNNTVGVGTTTLSIGSNNGTYGSLVISNDKDAVNSTRNTGIASGFYEIYDVAISNVPNCPDGFNCISIQHSANETSKTQSFWYEDGSTVSAPVLSTGVINIPSTLDHQVVYSSGVPHYSENAANAFTYVLTCQNASGDMYSNATFCTASGGTSGLISPGNKTYVNFGGSTIPTRNFGVGIGSTTLITQDIQNTHIQLASPVSFHTYTATTPYGSAGITTTLLKTINIMGSIPSTSKIDEDSIVISSLGSGSATPIRINAGSGDNPTPVTTGWDETISVATYEATVVGGILKHDQTNYSTGFLPSEGSSGIAPDYSTGRSGSQYFQLQIIRSAVSSFKITITGTYAGCWVCMPTNTTWTGSLSGTNGWANMFQAYKGSGVPTTADPGCSSGGVMTGSSGTFTCTFGTESSTNDTNNRILVRWKMTSGQSITAMSFSS